MATAAFLAGLRVLDFSIWRPGPYATSLLAGVGADVLKVEPPGGDPMRHYEGLFAAVNTGKRSIVLDLKAEAGRSRALELTEFADVVVEGFRPGVMGRLGLAYETVRDRNPAVVYCSISGYGQDGPRASLPGHDVNYQAWAAALTPEGGPAALPPLPAADLASGVTAAFGICAAVLGRAATGEGAYLDVAMTDVMATWTGPSGGGGSGTTQGPVADSTPGYGIFATADGGEIALGVVSEASFWSQLCGELGLSELAGLGFDERRRRGGELQRAIATAVGTRGRDELVTTLAAKNVPVAPVLDRAELLANALLPPFPIRSVPTGDPPPAPALDEHRGEGFTPRR